MMKLPPLTLSQVDNRRIPPGEDAVDYIVKRVYLTTHSYPEFFELLHEKVIDTTRVVLYGIKIPDPIYFCFDSDNDLEEVDEFRREYIIFLLYQESTYLLTTKFGFSAVQHFCSSEFPRRISHFYKDQVLKVERLVKKNLSGEETGISLPLQSDYDPTPQQYKKITLLIKQEEEESFSCTFTSKGIVINRQLSIPDHLQLIKSFPLENPPPLGNSEWGISLLPEEYELVQDEELVSNLDKNFMLSLVGYNDPEWLVEPELSMKITKNCTDLRIHVYMPHMDSWKRCGFNIPLENPCLGTDTNELIHILTWNLNNRVFCHPETIEDYLKEMKENAYRIEHKINGIWVGTSFMDAFQGFAQTPTGELYYRMSGRWYKISRSFIQGVNSTLEEVLDKSIISQDDPYHLPHPWPNELGETPYNELYRNQISEDESLEYYFADKVKTGYEFELGDIFCISKNHVIVYQVKKEFAGDTARGMTQLVRASEVISSSTIQDQNFRRYCKSVMDENTSPDDLEKFMHALLSKDIIFVLASPAKGDKSLNETIQSSRSLQAKREIPRGKAAIEKNKRFQFKIDEIEKD